MTCQSSNCSFNIFASCTNHCTQNLCLEHLIEHGDIFLSDFMNILDQLDESTCILMNETNIGETQIIKRRQYEIERINRIYNEEQEKIRQRITLAESANILLKEKQDQLKKSKEKNECYIDQHDFEQLKLYSIQINQCSFEQEIKKEKNSTETNLEIINNFNLTTNNHSKSYLCPLTKPNVFGIKLEHNLRYDCDGPTFRKYSLTKHLEYHHRMLPECAIRLRDAIINGQSSEQTKLFSENEIILNKEYLVDCPLIDSTNVFGACSSLNTLLHLPCTKKQITLPAMKNHFQSYHKMKYDAAKKIFYKLKKKSLTSDLILFENDERIGTYSRKK